MSGLYAGIQNAMVTGGFNWTAGTYAIMLVGPGYTPNYATDATLADIPSIAQLLNPPLDLSGETVSSAGACGAANILWTNLTTEFPVEGVAVLLTNAGDQSTWQLVCFIDEGEGFGQTPTAQAAGVIWDTRGIFQP